MVFNVHSSLGSAPAVCRLIFSMQKMSWTFSNNSLCITTLLEPVIHIIDCCDIQLLYRSDSTLANDQIICCIYKKTQLLSSIDLDFVVDATQLLSFQDIHLLDTSGGLIRGLTFLIRSIQPYTGAREGKISKPGITRPITVLTGLTGSRLGVNPSKSEGDQTHLPKQIKPDLTDSSGSLAKNLGESSEARAITKTGHQQTKWPIHCATDCALLESIYLQ